MSKMDGLRAMREAKYARAAAQAGTQPKARTRPTPVAPPVAPPASPAASAAEAGDGPAEERCGHRSMNGRTCTREAGHAAKNHRYS